MSTILVSCQAPSRRVRFREALLVLAFALAVYMTTAGGSLATTDGVAAYEVTRQIAERGSIAIPTDIVGNDAYRGPDGQAYSPFGLLQSIWGLPFYAAGMAISSLPPLRHSSPVLLTKATFALGNAVAAALCVWAVWWLTLAVAPAKPRTAALAALLAGFATSLWPYSKFGYNAPIAAALVTWCVLATMRGAEAPDDTRSWPAGMACGLALLTRHELALVAIPSVAVLIWGRPSRWRGRIAWWTAGAAPGAIAWLWYNYARFGSPLETGYLRDEATGLGRSVAHGLWGLLLSPGASVFLYSPAVVVAVVALVRLRRQAPRLVWLVSSLVALHTLFYAQLANWIGGRSYGPRYLVPFLPVLCVPLAIWMSALAPRARRWLMAWCALSLAVQVPGVLVDFAKVRVTYARELRSGSYEDHIHEWRACPLVLNARAATAAIPATARHLLGIDPPPEVRPDSGGTAGASRQPASTLDFWWVGLFYLGLVPGWVSLLLGILLTLTAAATARALRATLARGDPGAGSLRV